MPDVTQNLQNVIDQCTNFLNTLSPTVKEIDNLREQVNTACEFDVSGSMTPAALAQDLFNTEKAYGAVADILACADEMRIVRKKIADMVKQAAIRSSGQSSTDKRAADADFISGKFAMEAARFEGFYKFCEKKLDRLQMRYYSLRAALTSIEQDLRIGGSAGLGTRQIVDSAPQPSQSSLGDGQKKGGMTNWSDVGKK